MTRWNIASKEITLQRHQPKKAFWATNPRNFFALREEKSFPSMIHHITVKTISVSWNASWYVLYSDWGKDGQQQQQTLLLALLCPQMFSSDTVGLGRWKQFRALSCSVDLPHKIFCCLWGLPGYSLPEKPNPRCLVVLPLLLMTWLLPKQCV